MTHFVQTGRAVNATLADTTGMMTHVERIFAERRMPRCRSQSRMRVPKNGDRFSHRSSRGDDRLKK